MKLLRLGAGGVKEVSGSFLKSGARLGRGSPFFIFVETVLAEVGVPSVLVFSRLPVVLENLDC